MSRRREEAMDHPIFGEWPPVTARRDGSMTRDEMADAWRDSDRRLADIQAQADHLRQKLEIYRDMEPDCPAEMAVVVLLVAAIVCATALTWLAVALFS